MEFLSSHTCSIIQMPVLAIIWSKKFYNWCKRVPLLWTCACLGMYYPRTEIMSYRSQQPGALSEATYTTKKKKKKRLFLGEFLRGILWICLVEFPVLTSLKALDSVIPGGRGPLSPVAPAPTSWRWRGCADTGISSDFLLSIQEVRQPHYLFMLCYLLINQSLHHLGY